MIAGKRALCRVASQTMLQNRSNPKEAELNRIKRACLFAESPAGPTRGLCRTSLEEHLGVLDFIPV